MTELVRFKMVSTRADALWRGKEVGAVGQPRLILAGETEDDVKWFFSKIDWSAWRLERIESAPAEPGAEVKRGPGRPPKSTIA